MDIPGLHVMLVTPLVRRHDASFCLVRRYEVSLRKRRKSSVNKRPVHKRQHLTNETSCWDKCRVIPREE